MQLTIMPITSQLSKLIQSALNTSIHGAQNIASGAMQVIDIILYLCYFFNLLD